MCCVQLRRASLWIDFEGKELIDFEAIGTDESGGVSLEMWLGYFKMQHTERGNAGDEWIRTTLTTLTDLLRTAHVSGERPPLPPDATLLVEVASVYKAAAVHGALTQVSPSSLPPWGGGGRPMSSTAKVSPALRLS
jgi:hypothetical protein